MIVDKMMMVTTMTMVTKITKAKMMMVAKMTMVTKMTKAKMMMVTKMRMVSKMMVTKNDDDQDDCHLPNNNKGADHSVEIKFSSRKPTEDVIHQV